MRAWTAARIGGALSSLLLLVGAADARAQNIVQNPDFTGGLNGWTIVTGASYTVGWDSTEGNSAPGSATLNLTSSPGGSDVFFLTQCVSAAGSTQYDVGGSFRYPSSAATPSFGNVLVSYYSDTGCVTPFGGTAGFGLSSGTHLPDTWMTANYPGSLTTPAGTAAVRIYLRFSTPAPGTSFGWYDDIRITPTGQEYFTVAPCRVVDTRGGAPIGGPVLQGQQTRTLAVAGNCGIPSTAKAASVNLAVTQPSAAGNVRLFPAGQAVPTVSSINYAAGQTRGNNAIVQLDASGAIAAFVGQPAGTTVHLILDVNGYFE